MAQQQNIDNIHHCVNCYWGWCIADNVASTSGDTYTLCGHIVQDAEIWCDDRKPTCEACISKYDKLVEYSFIDADDDGLDIVSSLKDFLGDDYGKPFDGEITLSVALKSGYVQAVKGVFVINDDIMPQFTTPVDQKAYKMKQHANFRLAKVIKALTKCKALSTGAKQINGIRQTASQFV